MTKHLQNDLEYLEQALLAQSSIVEEMIDKACRGLRELRSDMAAEVMAHESVVDKTEIRIEEDCLKILALHQPVAVDLRRVATVLKINAELERIADLAVNIAERTESLCNHPDFPIPQTLERMAKLATQMVHNALDAFVRLDVRAAKGICGQDELVDEQNRGLILELRNMMQQHRDVVEPALHFLLRSTASGTNCRPCHKYCRGRDLFSGR